MRQFIVATILLLISGAAHAVGPAAPESTPQQQQATRIETDQKTGAVKIIVNNREIARFDSHGLHVWDGIEHARTITYSPSGFRPLARKP
jgi:hypothetical protein